MTNAATITEDDLLPGRATASGVLFQIGPGFTLPVDIITQASKDREGSSFPFACPDHGKEVVRCNQVYRCTAEKPHLHPEGELLRARESEDGKLVHASKDEIAEIRTGGLEKGVIDWQVHPAGEVGAVLRNGDLGYRCRPPKKGGGRKAFAVLKAIAEDPTIDLIGWLRTGDSRRLYRLECWNGQVFIQSLIPVTEMKGVDTIVLPELSDTEVKTVVKTVATLAEPFDPEEYRFDPAEAVAEFVAAKAENPDATPEVVAPAAVAEEADIIGLFEASISQAAKAKPAKKAAKATKAPAKKAAAARKSTAA
jgi:non-homologous end joining protein Ku